MPQVLQPILGPLGDQPVGLNAGLTIVLGALNLLRGEEAVGLENGAHEQVTAKPGGESRGGN